MKTDTIVAIATAYSDAGIGIIRVSGDEAFSIVDEVFRNKKGERCLFKKESHTISYGFIVDEKEGEWKENIVDEVMVSVLKAPKTYTMEDTVEINCHGGILLLNKVLELLLKKGARMALPGEFTKRAFLNGRIDLSKAEAVMDVIHSQNEFALSSSMKQLRGNVAQKVKELRGKIIYEIAFIESALDDPEHISLDGYEERLSEIAKSVKEEIDKLIASADNGKLMKEGINTCIVGKPNVGKSSLLNRMVGEERAIVTDIAGTTRDVLQESIRLQGIGLNIIDTAGIRNTDDVVEKIGVERAKEYAANADLVIYVVDASVPLDKSDLDIISVIRNKKVFVLLNKSDLKVVVKEEELTALFEEDELQILRTSTKENVGMEEFENTIKEMFFHGKIEANQEVVITNMRHKECLMDASGALAMVMQSLADHMPEDFYSIDLMSAYTSLGLIIGEEVEDDLLTEIFTNFCLGK